MVEDGIQKENPIGNYRADPCSISYQLALCVIKRSAFIESGRIQINSKFT